MLQWLILKWVYPRKGRNTVNDSENIGSQTGKHDKPDTIPGEDKSLGKIRNQRKEKEEKQEKQVET